MTKEKQKNIESVVSWLLAMLLCPLGICLCARSGFGVSMIEAPVYVLHLKLSEFWPWFTYGTSEYALQAVVLALMCVIIGRFRPRYLLCFATAFVFGWILDGWRLIIGTEVCASLCLRIVFAVIGCVGVAFAVALFFRTRLPLEVWELFVKEVADRFKFDIHRVKWVYDFSSLALGAILMFLFFGGIRPEAIGIGTVVTTFVNAPLIALSSRIQDKISGRIFK